MVNRLLHCHACSLHGPVIANRCACTANGKDITENAAAGKCPMGKFDGPPATANPIDDEAVKAQGRKQWLILHTKKDPTLEWFREWLKGTPGGCSCTVEANAIIADDPPDFGPGFFAWGVRFHDRINAKLGKPQFGLDAAGLLYPAPSHPQL